ncbi:sensor histidine kinase N-terminal domain-containing protein [Ramlibacter sp. H39-3-26]|uniref:sensor histidine kinase n=1 Tax=Curvibacter soli TaxID=3031331 RepID=UPI0023DABBEC|nr:sensor histidine kinase [Ramlibacter sp. H39-3-26]MDF1486385.1 sensor histidine kinase N-terminal domain-containing protein [Ramlibacter sp. H39-3-26]
MTAGVRNRLLVLLIVPLCLLALLNAWLDYRSADDAALRQDRNLLRMVPLLGDSIVAPAALPGDPPLLLAPPLEEFLKERAGYCAYAVFDLSGRLLYGDLWLGMEAPPATASPEFHSMEWGGVTYRIVAQRVHTAAGELVLALADGSNPRQHWLSRTLLRVLLPNAVLLAAAVLAVGWAVRRAFKPLRDLAEAVERRSPRDLSPIDEAASPLEVRPLVGALNRLFSLVDAQAESQRRFIADAAHQLRTPLAGVQAQVEAWALAAQVGYKPNQPAAQADQAPGAIVLEAQQLHKLRLATRRTSQLANQLLALSRADARAMEAQPMERVDLKDLCEAMLEQHLDAATAKHIDLGLDAAPARTTGHGWLLRELLGNLVDNAVRYTPEGGTVTIRCGVETAPGGHAQPFLQVEDDGPGIAPAERARVAQRFYRVPGTVGEGNGLGLAIAEEIARLHRAALSLASGGGGRGLVVTLVFAR